jgi:predicted Co/Zn/Cd cation transporter (cation efflux family)
VSDYRLLGASGLVWGLVFTPLSILFQLCYPLKDAGKVLV